MENLSVTKTVYVKSWAFRRNLNYNLKKNLKNLNKNYFKIQFGRIYIHIKQDMREIIQTSKTWMDPRIR